MSSNGVLGLIFGLGAVLVSGQTVKMPRKAPGLAKPECAKGAICFSGEVHEERQFRKHLTPNLDFIFDLPGGFDVVSSDSNDPCKLSAWVANPPLRAHHDTEVDAGYDWTAEQEAQTSPRQFRFPTTCADFERLLDLSENDAGKYLAQLNSLARGNGRLWITDARVTHSHGRFSPENGAIEWLKFSLEIELPSSH
jgi:hypothetical protein